MTESYNPPETQHGMQARCAHAYRKLLSTPRSVLLGVVVAMLCAAFYWPDIRFDASAETLVVNGDELFADYQRFRSEFPDDNFILVAAEPNDVELASAQSLALLKKMQSALSQISGVSDTLSILDVPILPLGRDVTLADPSTDREAALAFLKSQPLFSGQLISNDGEATAIRVGLSTDTSQHSRALEAIRAQLRPFETEADIYLGGVPLIAHDMIVFVQNDVRAFGIGIVLLLLAALTFFFRRARWVALNLVTAAVVCGLGAGLLGVFDIPMSVISANSISLLVIFSVSFTIHLVVRYRELLRTQPELSDRALVETTMFSKFAPCAFTALTTMVAFASLTTSGIRPVIDFGLMIAAGVALALLVGYLVFPALLLLLPRGEASVTLGKQLPVVNAFAALSTKRFKAVSIVALLTLGVAIAGMGQLALGGSFSGYFKADTQVRQGLRYIDSHFGGVLPLNIVLQLSTPADSSEMLEEDIFASPESSPSTYQLDDTQLRQLDNLVSRLRAREDVGSVTALSDVVNLLAVVSNTIQTDSFARSLALSGLAESHGQSLVRPYVSEDGSRLRISLRMRESASPANYASVTAQMRDLAAEAGFNASEIETTGMYVLFGSSLHTLFESQRNTVAAVILATLVMFLVLLRSLPFAILGVTANILAAMFTLGIMGWAGITLDMMTITVAAICIGIGVDDAIHYLHRFGQELKANGGDTAAAIAASHASIGRAAYFTSCTIALGFIVLILSQFVPTMAFGLLTAIAMAAAFVANLLVLPSLLMLFRRRISPKAAEQSAQ